MKLLFKPIPLALLTISLWITWKFISMITFRMGEWSVGAYGIWGDWSAHLTFIEAIRERGLGWILHENPLFADAPFRYPFLSHILTALFAAITGLSSIEAMKVSSSLLIFLLPFLLYRYFRRLGSSPIAGFYSTLAFLFLGGLQIFDSSLDPSKALTNQFEKGSVFTQFLVYEFIPQRAFLFAICLFLWIGGSIQSPLRPSGHSESPYGPRRVALFAIALGLLPLLHLHSFIAVAVLLLSFWIIPNPESPILRNRKRSFGFGLSVALISAAGIFFMFRQPNPNALTWNVLIPGWAQNPAANQPGAAAMNPIFFWIYNTGFFLPVSLAGIFLKPKGARLSAHTLAGITLFLLAWTFGFQPYFYDNLKIFTWAFLLLSPLYGSTLEKLHSLGRNPKRWIWIAPLLLAVQVASGVSDVFRFSEGLERTTWFGASDFEFAKEFKKIRDSSESRVLINPTHHHPIPCLAGNPVVMGYPGWLWSWGISYGALENDVGAILLGTSDAAKAIEKWKPAYVVIRAQENFQGKPIAVEFLESHFKRILRVGPWTAYRTDIPGPPRDPSF